MADIAITTYTNKTYKSGASTVVPGFVEGSPGSPVNPPGSGGASEFVPYVGANQNVNLGEFGLTTGNLIFDTTPTNIPTAQGAMYWDADDETVALIMNGAIQKVGEDAFYQVKNQTGSNIAKGVAVRFAGTVGNSGRLLIAPFLADGSYPSTYFMGVTMEAIPNGEDGKVMWFGRIRGINTNAYNEGDILYASTTVAGGFQTTVPQAPNNIVEVCAVVTKSTTVGTIFVRPTLGSNINRDEGVKITSGATGDLLQLQAGGLWENKSLATIGIPTGSGASGRVTFWTGANTVGSDGGFLWDNTNKRLGIGGTPLAPVHILANSNASIGYRVNNSSNGASAIAGIDFISNSVQGSLFATSSGYTTFGILQASNVGFYTNTTFAIAIDNNSADFKVGIGAGGPTERFRIFRTSGNVLLQNGGTFTDNGFRLDVNGTVRIQGKLTANGSTTSDSGLDLGTLRFQHFATNNAFIAENTFYNGSAFQRINTGLVSVFYLSNGGFQVGTLPTGNAGTTQTLLNNRLQLANDGKLIVADNVTGGQITFIESAILASNSTTRGFLTPRMTSVQRDAITTPATGLEVYQTTNNAKSIYNGSVWADVLTTSNYDGLNIAFGTGTGTKIGTATSQKIGFWNATPIVQPTTGVAESAFVENAGGTAVNDDSTFDGYTLAQIVKALRNAGLLA